MKMKRLIRPLEIKSADDEGGFSGYGSVFDVMDSYRDVVLPGAFEKSLAMHKEKGTAPALLWQHNPSEPIGVWNSFEEDDHGLKLDGELILDVQKGREAHALIKRKAVRGLSIGFSIPKGGEEYDKEKDIWNIKEVELWETSVVTFPANRDAMIDTVKSALDSPREFERLLRDVGLSQTQAKRLMAEGYNAICQKRDVDDEGDIEAIKKLFFLTE